MNAAAKRDRRRKREKNYSEISIILNTICVQDEGKELSSRNFFYANNVATLFLMRADARWGGRTDGNGIDSTIVDGTERVDIVQV